SGPTLRPRALVGASGAFLAWLPCYAGAFARRFRCHIRGALWSPPARGRPAPRMKATLYEALGISQTASDEEVRASLRRLIRKYYAKTRDGQGNVEEALRFINHASRILSDGSRRQRYDEELALSSGTAEQKIAHVVSNAIVDAGEQTDVHSAPQNAVRLDDFLDTQTGKKAPKENP